MKNEERARSLFGISLSDRPKWQQFLICSSGFFFGYLVNGICEVISLFGSREKERIIGCWSLELVGRAVFFELFFFFFFFLLLFWEGNGEKCQTELRSFFFFQPCLVAKKKKGDNLEVFVFSYFVIENKNVNRAYSQLMLERVSFMFCRFFLISFLPLRFLVTKQGSRLNLQENHFHCSKILDPYFNFIFYFHREVLVFVLPCMGPIFVPFLISLLENKWEWWKLQNHPYNIATTELHPLEFFIFFFF